MYDRGYNFRNCLIRWQISASIKVIPEHFSAYLRFKIPEVKVGMYNIHIGAIRRQIANFLSDGNF